MKKFNFSKAASKAATLMKMEHSRAYFNWIKTDVEQIFRTGSPWVLLNE